MPKCLVFIDNRWLFQDVRGFLSDTYGSSVTHCATDLTEVQGLLITIDDIQTIIADVPPGTTLEEHYDTLEKLTHGNIKIVFIVDLSGGTRIHKSNREFTIVPERDFRSPLKSALQTR